MQTLKGFAADFVIFEVSATGPGRQARTPSCKQAPTAKDRTQEEH